ncbi:MAG: Dyp-type peroxidase [Candidatus Nanopelagicales bacterium]
MTSAEPGAVRGLSRRGFLGSAAVVAGGGLAGGFLAGRAAAAGPPDLAKGQLRTPFYGEHQAGIATPLLPNAAFAAFDLHPQVDRAALIRLLRVWTDDASRLTDGRPALADPEPQLAGVPAGLTITLGLGIGALSAAGLAKQAPHWLAPLPDFAGEKLEKRWSQSDLLIICTAEDPLTVSHAVRVITASAADFATVHWVQRGFHRPAHTAPAGTGRNLMGQVDGTINPVAGSPDFAEIVWSDGEPAWLAGGTGLAVRRISMDLATWGALDELTKEQAIGRRLTDGAPLTAAADQDEFTPADFDALDEDGIPVIALNAHMRLGHSEQNSGKILRRPYNYDDGWAGGRADAGLIFTAYAADLTAGYVPMQQRMAEADVLNLWTTTIGSAVFALPPGIAPGQYLGQQLLE